jgi:predicted NACHT family NTPase
VPPQCAVTTRVTDTQPEMMKWDRVKTFYAGQDSGDTPQYAALHGTQLAECFAYVSHVLRLDNSCARPAHLLVLGEAGVGKTTFLERLARRLASSPSAVVSRRLNCVLLKGKRPEVVRKKLEEAMADLRRRRPALLILDSLDSMLPDQDASNAADDSMSAVQSLSLSLREMLKRLATEDLGGVVVAATALGLNSLHEELRPRKGSAPFLKCVVLQNPSREERQQLINTFLGESNLGPLPEEFLRATESFSVGDLERFAQRLKSKHGLSLSEARLLQEIHAFTPLSRWGRPLRPEVQKDLSMVGALGAAKSILTETLVWPSTYRAIYRK